MNFPLLIQRQTAFNVNVRAGWEQSGMMRRADKTVCLKDRRVVRFQFMAILSSFKKASKLHAVNGLILSLIALLAGIFLILSAFKRDCGLTVATDLCRETIVVGTVGGACLLIGSIFLVFSALLLYRLRNNDCGGVLAVIKLGCLTLASLDLIGKLFHSND